MICAHIIGNRLYGNQWTTDVCYSHWQYLLAITANNRILKSTVENITKLIYFQRMIICFCAIGQLFLFKLQLLVDFCIFVYHIFLIFYQVLKYFQGLDHSIMNFSVSKSIITASKFHSLICITLYT